MLIDKIIMIVDVFLCKIIRPTVLIPAMASKEFGNEKKPRRLPMNFMGTIILILSISIVGPMWLMSLKDASHGAQTVHANKFFRDKIDELEIKFVSQGRPIDCPNLCLSRLEMRAFKICLLTSSAIFCPLILCSSTH